MGGKELHSCLYLFKYFSMVGRPSLGLMLVYMEVASDVNSLVDGGSVGRRCRD